ncbi:sirohydrochlorin chelatase [Pseudonocardia sp. N23]|uniref:sirohydrochlorin chelatase n=1 Tax=Pseudonocardia sp. N23 TaxID=1987376 RepID=UPI000BFCFD9A|nr:sirohydrochlorin chelatase [Pseudonocardia sp. N23]GAY08555.1 sirohydrochlorin ferrochelatase [Pseudonocardia sp. N23]
MSDPALVAVAHGSRDGRSAATMHRLVQAAAAQAPGLDVRLSFLDFNAPRLPDVLHAVAADGHRRAVVVPLLLGSAYHARVDVPAAVEAATSRLPQLRVTVSPVLGEDPTPLLAAARARLAEAGADLGDPDIGVVLAAAGSSDENANDVVRTLAGRLPRAIAAFATSAEPSVDDAVACLRAVGAQRIVVLPWFLAPGRLLDRVEARAVAADRAATVAEPLGDHPLVAATVLARHGAGAGEPVAALADAV